MADFSTRIELPVPGRMAFDYLADPANRPQWQSSLKSVHLPEDATPRLGLQWTETTWAGVRPRMEITRMRAPRVWAEVGHWAGITGRLTMEIAAADRGRGCYVTLRGSVEGNGPYRALAWMAAQLAGAAIDHDVRRAGQILAERLDRD